MGAYVSVHGRSLGFDSDTKELHSSGKQITPKCVFATVASVPASGVTAITVTLRDANGAAINYVETVEVFVFTSSAMTAFAVTGGSTGLAIATHGALLALVAKKAFVMTCETTGIIGLTYTDTQQEASFLAVRLPNGVIIGADVTTLA